MDELLFTGVPIRKDTRAILDKVTEQVCNGMTDSEKKAYELGVENTFRAMECLLECDDEPKLYMPELEISTEMTLDEVVQYFNKYE